MSAEHDAYVSAGLGEMRQTLAEGRKVWGWQWGARFLVASVDLAPPTDEQWAYVGTTPGGREMYFTTFGVEGVPLPEDPAEDASLRWLEGIAYGSGPRADRTHALRLLCMLPNRARRIEVDA